MDTVGGGPQERLACLAREESGQVIVQVVVLVGLLVSLVLSGEQGRSGEGGLGQEEGGETVGGEEAEYRGLGRGQAGAQGRGGVEKGRGRYLVAVD